MCKYLFRIAILQMSKQTQNHRRIEMEDNGVKNSVMIGSIMLVAGGVVGAAVALLYAPQSGRQTRRDVARYSRKVRRQAENIIDDFAGNVHSMVESISERSEEILDKGKDMAHETKIDLLRVIDEGHSRLGKQKDRLAKLIG